MTAIELPTTSLDDTVAQMEHLSLPPTEASVKAYNNMIGYHYFEDNYLLSHSSKIIFGDGVEIHVQSLNVLMSLLALDDKTTVKISMYLQDECQMSLARQFGDKVDTSYTRSQENLDRILPYLQAMETASSVWNSDSGRIFTKDTMVQSFRYTVATAAPFLRILDDLIYDFDTRELLPYKMPDRNHTLIKVE